MRADTKHSILIWSIVALLLMNISTLVTIVYHQRQSTEARMNPVADQKQLETNAERFSGRYFHDQLNLNSEQTDKFRLLNPAFRPKARQITIELAQKRKQMLIEMSNAKSDTSRLNAISDSIGYLHSNLKKITYKYYLDIKSFCNPEQQQKLEKLFDEMFTNDAPMGFSGNGKPGGWQHGKQLKN